MKKINHVKLKICMLILVVVLMVVQIGPFLVYADESRLTFSWVSFGLPCTNEYYNGSGLSFAKARVGQYVGYCLDYGVPLPTYSGGTIQYLRTLSPVATAVLKYGYPYSSAAQLGVASEEEAEFATQIAVWGVVNSTNHRDSYKTNCVLDMNNLKPTSGYEAYMARVKAAAQRLIDRAIADPYYSNPKFYINPANAKMTVGTDYMLAGPYEIKATGFDVSSISVSLANAPGSAQITDANGNAKPSVGNGESIYIKMPKTETGSEFTINASASGSTVIGKAYGTGNMSDGTQDYGVLVPNPVQLNDSCKVKWDTLTGNVRIYKVDQYKNIIPGVKFELRDMNDKFVSSGTTNEQGILEFNNLKIGKYKLVEIEVPDGYIIARDPFEFEVTTGQTKEITFQNKKIEPSNIKIYKVDQYGNIIPGVKFELRDMNDKFVSSGVTNEQGILEFNNIKAGKYKLVEIEVPDGYVIAREPLEFEVNSGETKEITFQNKKLGPGKIKITKIDQDNNRVPGCTFELKDADGNLIYTGTTDKDGILEFDNLKEGTYYLKEISAPEGYEIKKDPVEVKVPSNKIIALKFPNRRIDGNLKIVKTTEGDNKPLAGVEFEILNADKKVVDTIVTDANGIATSKKLIAGKYYYRESKVPEGIILDPTEYEFTLSHQEITKEVVNKYAKGTLKVLKVDENKVPVKGVKFEIYDANKNLVDTIVTDEKGEAVSKELTLGTYYYKEVEAPDYVIMDTEMHEFKLTKNNEVVIKNLVNKLVKGKLRVVKTTETGTPVPNVTFQILNEAKDVIETITTNEEGIAETKPLKAGKYYYREIEAPVNVIPDYTEHEFIIENNEQVIEKEVINELVKGSLKVIKTDDLKAPIANVKFEILDKDKNVIQTITTDEEGIAVSDKLTIGKYYYREIEAPDNVVMDPKEYEFKITENDQIIEKEIENKRIEGKLIIYKQDKDTKQPIEGVTFQVLNEAKEVIETIITDKDGVARVGGLLKGTYYFKEIEAPEEYIMNTEEFSFEIVKDMQTVEKTVYNEHKKLPVTGGFIGTNTLIVIIVAVVVIAGYVTIKLVLNRKNAKHDNN